MTTMAWLIADQRPMNIVNVDAAELWYSRQSFARAKNYRAAENCRASETNVDFNNSSILRISCKCGLGTSQRKA